MLEPALTACGTPQSRQTGGRCRGPGRADGSHLVRVPLVARCDPAAGVGVHAAPPARCSPSHGSAPARAIPKEPQRHEEYKGGFSLRSVRPPLRKSRELSLSADVLVYA